MRSELKGNIRVPEISISVPIDKQTAILLQSIFIGRIGALNVSLKEDNNAELVISCFSSKEIIEDDNYVDMYSIGDRSEYETLRKVVIKMINEYFDAEDERLLREYRKNEYDW